MLPLINFCLILRNSRRLRLEGCAAASWFETRCFATLLTMRS
jgi:hypothetical protein